MMMMVELTLRMSGKLSRKFPRERVQDQEKLLVM